MRTVSTYFAYGCVPTAPIRMQVQEIHPEGRLKYLCKECANKKPRLRGEARGFSVPDGGNLRDSEGSRHDVRFNIPTSCVNCAFWAQRSIFCCGPKFDKALPKSPTTL